MDIGLECYVSQHAGFEGQIKRSYEDFQVTEIDEHGLEVQLNQNTADLSAFNSVSKNHECKTITDEKNVSLGHGSGVNMSKSAQVFYQPEDIKSSIKIKEAEDKLTNVVGESVISELSQLSSSLANKPGCLLLGSFGDKKERALIHLHSRMAFPAIKTTTVQQDGVYTITANVDHVFLEFLGLVPDRSEVENLLRFCHCIDKNLPASYDLPCNADKNCRTKIHRLLLKRYGSYLESKTFTAKQDQQTCIQVRTRTGNNNNRAGSSDFTRKRIKASLYTGFVLKKKNMETLEAIEHLSKCVGVYPSDFSYAGTKDKKAITLQNMAVKGATPQQLSEANDAATPNIETGTYKLVEKPMKMGQLTGNAFRIMIRDVNYKQDLERSVNAIYKNVAEAMNNTATNGFVNYFGHQRFGHEEGVGTRADAIGLAMLQGNLVQAVNLLLMPHDDKSDNANNAKRYYQETGDLPGTLSRMPHSKIRERLLLKSLRRHGNDDDGCRKALLSIPYSMRLLYAHSFTSLIWNKMASLRVLLHGTSGPVVGDLVYDDTEDPKIPGTVESHVASSNLSDGNDEFARSLHKPANKSRVKVVTDEDFRTGKYAIRDLVLPMPGYNVLYPTNAVGERYREILKDYGITDQGFRLRSLGLSLPGTYRKLLAFPNDLQYKWIGSESTSKTVHPNSVVPVPPVPHSLNCTSSCGENLGSMQGTKNKGETLDSLRASITSFDNDNSMEGNSNGNQANGMEPKEKRSRRLDIVTGRECSYPATRLDLEVSFKLDPSCYATMCLREMMVS